MDDVEVVLLRERGRHRGVEYLGHRLAEARRRGLGEDGVEALCGCLVLARADLGHLVPSCHEAVGVARSMLGPVVPPHISSLLLSGLEPTRRARPPLASASALHEIGRRRALCRASSPGVWVARSASSSSATGSSSSKTWRIPATLTPSRMSARAARSRRMSALLYRRWSLPLRVGVTIAIESRRRRNHGRNPTSCATCPTLKRGAVVVQHRRDTLERDTLVRDTLVRDTLERGVALEGASAPRFPRRLSGTACTGIPRRGPKFRFR